MTHNLRPEIFYEFSYVSSYTNGLNVHVKGISLDNNFEHIVRDVISATDDYGLV